MYPRCASRFTRYSQQIQKLLLGQFSKHIQIELLSASVVGKPKTKSSLGPFRCDTKNHTVVRRPRRSLCGGAQWMRPWCASTGVGEPPLTTPKMPSRPWRAVASSPQETKKPVGPFLAIRRRHVGPPSRGHVGTNARVAAIGTGPLRRATLILTIGKTKVDHRVLSEKTNPLREESLIWATQ